MGRGTYQVWLESKEQIDTSHGPKDDETTVSRGLGAEAGGGGMKIRNFLCIAVCLNSAAALLGPASFASDFQSPRTLSLGGAGHAGPLLNDSIYLNPAFGSFLPSYAFALNYTTFSGPSLDGVNDYHGRLYNVSVQDGRSELFQAGVGFTQREDTRALHIGASKAVIKQLGFGLGAKFFFPPDSFGNPVKDMSFSIGALPLDWLQVSLLIDNLIEPDPIKAMNLYREIVLGTKFNFLGSAMLYIDPHYMPSLAQPYGHEIGLEITMFADLFFRLGLFKNATLGYIADRGRGYGLGIGWIGPRLSLDYAFSRVLEPHDSIAHSFSATIFF